MEKQATNQIKINATTKIIKQKINRLNSVNNSDWIKSKPSFFDPRSKIQRKAAITSRKKHSTVMEESMETDTSFDTHKIEKQATNQIKKSQSIQYARSQSVKIASKESIND